MSFIFFLSVSSLLLLLLSWYSPYHCMCVIRFTFVLRMRFAVADFIKHTMYMCVAVHKLCCASILIKSQHENDELRLWIAIIVNVLRSMCMREREKQYYIYNTNSSSKPHRHTVTFNIDLSENKISNQKKNGDRY